MKLRSQVVMLDRYNENDRVSIRWHYRIMRIDGLTPAGCRMHIVTLLSIGARRKVVAS